MNKLWEAIDVINERGWIQGSMENDHGVCLLGAYRRACGLQPNQSWDGFLNSPAEVELDLLDETALEQYGALGFVAFNDQLGTTKDDVITLLAKAAIKKDELV